MKLVHFIRIARGHYVQFPHRCPGWHCALCHWVLTRA
jgi:ferredoxin